MNEYKSYLSGGGEDMFQFLIPSVFWGVAAYDISSKQKKII